MAGAIRFLVNCSVVSASSTRLPLIRSSTSRAFCGETRVKLALALNSMKYPLHFYDFGGAGAAGAAGAIAPGPPGTPAGRATASAAAFTECPLNCRVKENSPSLCPTMFSVMYTGINFLPLCTPIVCPTISGEIVERRDQVRTTFLSFFWFMSSIFFIRWPSMCGPFFNERAMYSVSSENCHHCQNCQRSPKLPSFQTKMPAQQVLNLDSL